MRHSDVRPQAFVACFDAETGRRRCARSILAAETPGGNQTDEITGNLLTFDQGSLYYNTNLGAVVAPAVRDGSVQWIVTYPRAKATRADASQNSGAHLYRDLNPCICYDGLVIAAPSDSPSIFALDASGGQMIWETREPTDATQLLGVAQGNLVASGDRLWWLDAATGKVLRKFPEEGSPLGYGRGLLAGDRVYWPTREYLYVLDQAASVPTAALREDPIALSGDRGASGGNLVSAGGILLIATPTKLFGFEQRGAKAVSPAPVAADQSSSPPAGPISLGQDARPRPKVQR